MREAHSSARHSPLPTRHYLYVIFSPMSERGHPPADHAAATESAREPERRRRPFFVALARFLVRRRAPLFYGLVALILAGALFIPRIVIDNSIELWFLEDDPALVSYNGFKSLYGNDEVVVAAVDSGRPGGVFEPAFLNRLREATLAMEKNPLVRRAVSIGKSPWIGLTGSTDEATLVVEDMMTGPVSTAAEADAVRARFRDSRLPAEILADRTLRHAIVMVEPVASKEMDQHRPAILAHVRGSLGTLPFRLAGMGVMYNELNELSLRDGGLYTTLSYVVLVLAVFLLFRSGPMTGIIVVVMALSGLAFLGVFGLFRQNINMVTMVLPTLIMILSIADVNHIFNHYTLHRARIAEDREEGLVEVYADVLAPSLFTSVTEAIGFASLLTSSIAVLRTFGLFAACSAMAEFAIVMITCAYFLPMLDPGKVKELARPFERENARIIDFATGRAGLVTLVFLAAIVLSFAGIARLEVDTYSMDFLKKGNPVRVDSDAVEATYGNYLPLEIRLRAGRPDGVRTVDFLRRVRSAEIELESTGQIRKVASLTDIVMRLNQVWTDGAPGSYRIPDTDLQVVQLLDFYSGDPDSDLKYMTDPDYSELRLTARIPMVAASGMKKIEDAARERLERIFAGTGVAVEFSGYVPLYVRLLDYITASQVWSFGTALLYIFLMIGILFRRASALFLGIAPNVVPIVMTLGVMGLAGIRLDIATVTIASITLGIAVDDTIHELFRYYEFLDAGHPPREAIRRCLHMEGTAVISASIILALGFSVLGLASIKSVVYFGLLIALTMVFAFLGELFMLPATITWFSRSGK